VIIKAAVSDSINLFVGTETPHLSQKDVDMVDAVKRVRPICPCEWMDSEDTLFVLYTSGSTGKPKGVAHTTAGYLLNATITTQNTFDIRVSASATRRVI
jgi:acetyl-CoA synthetase